MAKALFGHVGSGADARLATEVTRLRARVAELETDVDRLRTRVLQLEAAGADEIIVVPDTVPDTVVDPAPAYT
jgi:phospholipase/lecithinase/hemolysin